MKIVGIQRGVSFKIDGNTFSGINLFGAVERPGIDGVATEKIFVNSEKECFAAAASLSVGDDVDVYYNRFGKVDQLIPKQKK